MSLKISWSVLLWMLLFSCNQSGKTSTEPEGHEQEEIKFYYTAYSNEFELFAEADPFVSGEPANVLSHFSVLPGFTPLDSGKVTVVLTVNGKETRKTIEKSPRKGIYSFDIQPEAAGSGTLKYEISCEKGNFEILVPEISVFSTVAEAQTAAAAQVPPKTNATQFTKEQSWKTGFSTGLPTVGPFGEVIKTTALVEPSQGNESVVSAGTGGIVRIISGNLLEGKDVSKGQPLFFVSGIDMADNNLSVRFAGAQSNYEKAKADYERVQELAKERIVPAKDLLAAKNKYENDKAVFENLSKNFSAGGQTIVSPMGGFIRQVFVQNGSYVEAGQPLAEVSQSRTLTLTAELPMKYASILGTIYSANITTPYDNRTYSLEELNGKVLAYGKSAGAGTYLVPIRLQIDNSGGFVPGSFVEVYLKTMTSAEALTVPVVALLEDQGTFFVWVQVTPELFEKREVKTGKTDGVRMQILGGLGSDERVVTRGAILIKLAQSTGALDAHSGHVH